MHNIKDNLEVRYIGDLVAAGSTIDNNATRIDMQDYESALFIAPITASVSTGVATLTIEHGDTDADTAGAAITGAVRSLTSAGTNDIAGKMLVVEVARPAKRYLQAVRTSATANITFGPITVVLMPKTRRPVTQHASVGTAVYVSD